MSAPSPTAQDARHGTLTAYQRRKCRCDECRRCWREYTAKYRARKRADSDAAKRWTHGTNTTYTSWGCRCAACQKAAATRARSYYVSVRDDLLARLRRERAQKRQAWDDCVEARTRSLAAARAAATGELAELIAEQANDERRFRMNGATSLDRTIRDQTLLEWVDYGQSVTLGPRYTPDFANAVCELLDARREIDGWAEAA